MTKELRIHVKTKHGWRRAGRAYVRKGNCGEKWISGTVGGVRVGIW